MKTESELQVWYYCLKKYLGKNSTYWEICRIQIKIYPQTTIVLTYNAIFSNNEVSVRTSSLTLWLSWRVAPPLAKYTWIYMNLSELAKIYRNLPEFTWVYLNLPNFTKIYLSLLEYTWIYLNLLKFT